MSVHAAISSRTEKELKRVVDHTMETILSAFHLTIYSIGGAICTIIFLIMLQQSTADIVGQAIEFFLGQPLPVSILLIAGFLVKKASILKRINIVGAMESKPIQNLVLGPIFVYTAIRLHPSLPYSIPELGNMSATNMGDWLITLFLISAVIGLLAIWSALMVNGLARIALNFWTFKAAVRAIMDYISKIYLYLVEKNILARYWQVIHLYKIQNDVHAITAVLKIFHLGIEQVDPGLRANPRNDSEAVDNSLSES